MSCVHVHIKSQPVPSPFSAPQLYSADACALNGVLSSPEQDKAELQARCSGALWVCCCQAGSSTCCRLLAFARLPVLAS